MKDQVKRDHVVMAARSCAAKVNSMDVSTQVVLQEVR